MMLHDPVSLLFLALQALTFILFEITSVKITTDNPSPKNERSHRNPVEEVVPVLPHIDDLSDAIFVSHGQAVDKVPESNNEEGDNEVDAELKIILRDVIDLVQIEEAEEVSVNDATDVEMIEKPAITLETVELSEVEQLNSGNWIVVS